MATIRYSIVSIPQDLTIEILLRLPAKSVLRFKSVSKSWRSIITSQQFINAFMVLSLSRPRLFLGFSDFDDERVLFFSAPHPSCSFFEESSVLVSEKNTLTMPKSKSNIDYICNSVCGFLCCSTKDGFVVCNPTTGQVIHLNDMNYDNYKLSMYLGYDPDSDQYKVLRIMSLKFSDSNVEHSVRTLGGQGSSNLWRPIKTSILYYDRYLNSVCIDGVVYYRCEIIEYQSMISCFDVGSEQLSLIKNPEDFSVFLYNYLELTNYLEKLALYCCSDNECKLWVLDDFKNQVWSMKTYIFQSPSTFFDFRFKGVTSSKEIVYVPFLYIGRCDSDYLKLRCYNVEKKMERKVKVEGLSKIGHLYPYIFCSYVENIVYL